jgi:tripartite ATP-independent transporter DctM subunit
MEPLGLGILMIIMLLFLIFIGMPIAFSLGLSGIFCLLAVKGWKVTWGFLMSTPYNTSFNWAFVVLPLFILTGELAFASGIGKNAFDLANKWLGRLRGGLAIATIMGCGIFGAVCGSSLAAASAMGKITIPEMRRFKYAVELALGAVAAGGTLSIMIPPSGILVIYGILTEESIGRLLIAGILPGVLSMLIYSMGIYVWTKINPNIAPSTEKSFSWKEKVYSIKGSYGALIIFIIIIGGIYTGLATPNEAAALGALAALIMMLIICKDRISVMGESLRNTTRVTCMFLFIVICAAFFTLGLAVSGIPDQLTRYMTSLHIHPLALMALLLIPYIPLGMLLDTVSMLVITLPVIYPVVKALGFSGIWFGILVTKLIEVSLMTPPVGLNVFVISGIVPDVPISRVFKGCIPFLIMDLVTLSLLFFFPEISTWLPDSMLSK